MSNTKASTLSAAHSVIELYLPSEKAIAAKYRDSLSRFSRAALRSGRFSGLRRRRQHTGPAGSNKSREHLRNPLRVRCLALSGRQSLGPPGIRIVDRQRPGSEVEGPANLLVTDFGSDSLKHPERSKSNGVQILRNDSTF